MTTPSLPCHDHVITLPPAAAQLSVDAWLGGAGAPCYGAWWAGWVAAAASAGLLAQLTLLYFSTGLVKIDPAWAWSQVPAPSPRTP